ncbi:leader peptidase (prepilin peptidase) / N-methyltransferase [Ruminococcaceae bacterium YRB3002]|nr:leader peptidase (prepilin peptidase) / N-methyltransferase [Ruminococcaceae bacterium YRB3002]
MTTEDSGNLLQKLLRELRSVPSPVFYIFAAVAVFAGIYVCGFNVTGIFITLFLLLLVACGVADINAGIIPDLLVIAIAVLGVVFIVVNGDFSSGTILSHLIGAVCISVPMLILSLIVNGAFGGGDIKLMAAAGLFLGWRYAVTGVVIGMFLSGFYGMYLLLLRKADPHSKIRIAPFLVYGLGIASLFGEQFIRLVIWW